jgi:hypothetical protein
MSTIYYFYNDKLPFDLLSHSSLLSLPLTEVLSDFSTPCGTSPFVFPA